MWKMQLIAYLFIQPTNLICVSTRLVCLVKRKEKKIFLAPLGNEARALHKRGKHSTIESEYPSSKKIFFKNLS